MNGFNWWNGKGFGVFRDSYETETVGYEMKWISEVTGYRDELGHTETYQVQAGTRMVLAGYRPFGAQGAALALTAWHLALRQVAGTAGGNPEAVYQQILARGQADGSPGTVWLLPDAGQWLETVIAKGASRLRSASNSAAISACTAVVPSERETARAFQAPK